MSRLDVTRFLWYKFVRGEQNVKNVISPYDYVACIFKSCLQSMERLKKDNTFFDATVLQGACRKCSYQVIAQKMWIVPFSNTILPDTVLLVSCLKYSTTLKHYTTNRTKNGVVATSRSRVGGGKICFERHYDQLLKIVRLFLSTNIVESRRHDLEVMAPHEIELIWQRCLKTGRYTRTTPFRAWGIISSRTSLKGEF